MGAERVAAPATATAPTAGHRRPPRPPLTRAHAVHTANAFWTSARLAKAKPSATLAAAYRPLMQSLAYGLTEVMAVSSTACDRYVPGNNHTAR